MNRCISLNGDHHFEARYDKGPSKPPAELRFHAVISQDAFRQITYVCDICIICGATVKRDGNVVQEPGPKKPST